MIRALAFCFATLVLAPTTGLAQTQFTVRYENAGITTTQTQSSGNVPTETFTGGINGTIGDYSPTFTTTNNQLNVQAQNGATSAAASLALTTNSNNYGFFGLYVVTADQDNRIAFFRDDTSVFTFDVKNLIDANVVANENNIYLNFYANNQEALFNRVEFSETGVGGFESDNHSALAGLFTGTQSGEVFTPTPVPEPASNLALTAVGLVAVRRFRR